MISKSPWIWKRDNSHPGGVIDPRGHEDPQTAALCLDQLLGIAAGQLATLKSNLPPRKSW